MKTIRVVAAIMKTSNENGETPQDTLKREITEELENMIIQHFICLLRKHQM